MSEPNVEKESNVEKEPGPQPESLAAASPSDNQEKKKREYKDFGHETEKATRMSVAPLPLSPN